MATLRQRLDDLASTFAEGVVAAIRAASIEEVLAESEADRGAGTRARGGARTRVAAGTGSEAEASQPGGARAVAARRAGERLARRSSADIQGIVERIVDLVRQSPRGLRAEQIRDSLALQPNEMPRPLREALEGGKLGKKGEKRATTYFAERGGSAGGAASEGAGDGGEAGGEGSGAGDAGEASGAPRRRASRSRARSK